MTKAVLIQAPIKGVFDKEVNVGDQVMVVSTGWSNVYVRKGVYKGYIEGTGYYKKRARVEVQEMSYQRLWNDTKEPVTYSSPRWQELRNRDNYYAAYEQETHVITVPYMRETTLNLNRIATIKE
jgi:hypothetical protein